MNSVNLVGRLTQDPRLSYTQSGRAVTNFTIAIDRRTSEKQTDFIDCVCWEKTAENVAQYVKKGRQVAVEGRIQTRNYEHEGQRRKVVEVLAHNVQFLGSPRDDG